MFVELSIVWGLPYRFIKLAVRHRLGTHHARRGAHRRVALRTH